MDHIWGKVLKQSCCPALHEGVVFLLSQGPPREIVHNAVYRNAVYLFGEDAPMGPRGAPGCCDSLSSPASSGH